MDVIKKDTHIEVSLIGTGGGYGESIILNIGNNNWIVIDSCQDPYTKNSLPLEYLRNNNVDLANDVKMILCTHWHDDHILGLSDLLEECTAASFCFASTTDKEKFLLMVGLDYHKAENSKYASSTIELSKCLRIINKRKGKIISAVQDRLIYSVNTNGINSEIYSLTPSDFVLAEFDKEISKLMTDYHMSNIRIPELSPNEKSVALLIKIDDQRILLGADLEVSSDDRKGWICVLNNCLCVDQKCSIFKIPHHGSENGFHRRIWDEIINENAIANLTPWKRGHKLPTKEMLQIYRSYTDSVYMTSPINSSKKPKRREKSIAKAIERFNRTVEEQKFDFGIIQCVLDLSQEQKEWDVKLIDKAIWVSEEVLHKNKF